MARPLIDDALWALIEPLLPPPKPRRADHPGRRPVDAPLAKELARQTALFEAFLRGEDVPEEPDAGPAFKAAWDHSETVRLSAHAEDQRVAQEAGEHGA